MTRAEKVFPNLYRDSVALMEVSARISKLPGIAHATAVMATQSNIALLAEAGLLSEHVRAGPNDLLIVIEGGDESSIIAALREVEFVANESSEPAVTGTIRPMHPTSLQMALEDTPSANLALISTPGEYAAAEAEKAMRLGLNVMVFSANVAVEDEIALKRMARDRALLMMGPDCGTAIVNGVPLGFANVVRRGPIGLVASAGTGLQEVTSLIDRAGIGVSHALGCGGRDLSDEVGGMSMLQGLTILTSDPSTKVIVLIAKYPAPKIAHLIVEAARNSGKPVVINFLGIDVEAGADAGIYIAETLEDAARLAVVLVSDTPGLATKTLKPAALSVAAPGEAGRLGPHQKYIRGLFSGGTFCYESQVLLSKKIGAVWSNAPIASEKTLPDVWQSREHTLIDLGDNAFTRGRPHPLIDQRLRLERLAQELRDPDTAVILFDVVLGYAAHPNPAAEIADAIVAAQRDRPLIFVASVCGTDRDPQNLPRQEAILKDAGVLIAPSNAAATRIAADLILAHRKRMDHQ